MKTLLVGYKAADLTPKMLAAWGEVTCFCLDIYHRHAIEKVHHLKAVCAAHLPEDDWDVIRFRTGPKLMSGELALDLLQECYRRASHVELDFVGRERDRNDLLNKVIGKHARVRSFAATYRASVPGGPSIELTSFPGCFCHRRTDEGGLALAEVASREVCSLQSAVCSSNVSHRGTEGMEAQRNKNLCGSVSSVPLCETLKTQTANCKLQAANSALRLLDMGCGNGLVGFLIASAFNQTISNQTIRQSLDLVMVDSHARAVEAANLNAKNLGIPAEVILADNGTPARMDGTFDVFVGNPPYYSEYRIAEVFYETARRVLKPGGVCYMVCKNAAGLEPVARQFFPEVEIIHRRTYAVLKSRA